MDLCWQSNSYYLNIFLIYAQSICHLIYDNTFCAQAQKEVNTCLVSDLESVLLALDWVCCLLGVLSGAKTERSLEQRRRHHLRVCSKPSSFHGADAGPGVVDDVQRYPGVQEQSHCAGSWGWTGLASSPSPSLLNLSFLPTSSHHQWGWWYLLFTFCWLLWGQRANGIRITCKVTGESMLCVHHYYRVITSPEDSLHFQSLGCGLATGLGHEIKITFNDTVRKPFWAPLVRYWSHHGKSLTAVLLFFNTSL